MAERAPHTLYQVSTATALVEGIYLGAVQVATPREHGDLGLGTFESLDGENDRRRRALLSGAL
jgi:alpha-acetolactate decarboxylase